MWVTWLLLNVKLLLGGALQLLAAHSWIASECPPQRFVFAGSAGYSYNRFWQCSKRKICKRCTDYNWKNLLLPGDGTIFRGFLPNQPWLASQPTSAWLHSPLLYIDKYNEIGTIYASETFTCMVLHAFTVSYGISKSHLQWNPPSSLTCHLFSWSKWNLGLGGLQKWPMASAESQAGVCCQLGQVAAVDCTSD